MPTPPTSKDLIAQVKRGDLDATQTLFSKMDPKVVNDEQLLQIVLVYTNEKTPEFFELFFPHANLEQRNLALLQASQENHMYFAKKLLESGADPLALGSDINEMNAITLAIQNNREKMAKLLLEYVPILPSNDHLLFLACQKKMVDVVSMLLPQINEETFTLWEDKDLGRLGPSIQALVKPVVLAYRTQNSLNATLPQAGLTKPKSKL